MKTHVTHDVGPNPASASYGSISYLEWKKEINESAASHLTVQSACPCYTKTKKEIYFSMRFYWCMLDIPNDYIHHRQFVSVHDAV